MPETTSQATALAAQYTAQVTGDLELNVQEQERVSADITALQQQLAALQHDHALLVNMQQALGVEPPSARRETTSGAAAVPAPRDGAGTGSGGTGRSRSRKSSTATAEKPATKKAATNKVAPKKAATKKAAPKKAAAEKTTTKKSTTKKATTKKATAEKSPARTGSAQQARPTLVELVRAHLVEQGEPRSAAEVTSALAGAHPERNVKPTVVRTTLEGLVAKNQAQRSKQGSSVYYTASDAPAATGDAPAEPTSGQTGS
ncbi:hypothetical protein GCM10010377_41080 [Streptomyces viridiviolaceus]|uniref:Regulatory protein n=1 Tax=Streptomyces viridiviolaceus TaxID=68282 RepID=A0ABW2E7L7_9ACTN|nr:hypothetical protein [Streptomyces viridiviolaceus]GHB45993.1 hypothetical protein GCM10010377_41080 [Streptomyces viridiviolaceus]